MFTDEGRIIEVRAAEETLVNQAKTCHLADQFETLSYICNEAVSTNSQWSPLWSSKTGEGLPD
jgi:hypothetical protein